MLRKYLPILRCNKDSFLNEINPASRRANKALLIGSINAMRYDGREEKFVFHFMIDTEIQRICEIVRGFLSKTECPI